jgi:palmitoyl transferase
MGITVTAKNLYKIALFSLGAAAALGAPHAIAQQAPSPEATQAPETTQPSLWVKTRTHVADIAEQGRWDLYLSGYAHHNRNSYSEKSLRKLNEKAWGAGIGKTLRNGHGNDESLYFIGLRDSRRHAQFMAGYAYQWVHGFGADSGLEMGAGLTAAIIRRQGVLGGKPFPAILPVASIGTQSAKLMVTFIPHVAIRNNKGNVVLLFARFEFK